MSNLICLFSGDFPHGDCESHPENPPAEMIKHRRLFSRVGNRPRSYKVKTTDFLSNPACHLILPGSKWFYEICILALYVQYK